MEESLKRLKSKSALREQPFRSEVPVIGGLIAGFRRLWNNVSTRWYVLPMIQQQNEFNAALIEELRAQFAEVYSRQSQFDQQLMALDHDQTELMRTLAEVHYQVIQLRRQVETFQNGRGQEGE